jgi:transposase
MNKASASVRERWRRIIMQQRNSGLGAAEFCRGQQVAPSTFFAWKRRLAREAQSAGPAFVQLKAVSVPQPDSVPDSSDGAIELHLGQGRHLLLRPGFDRPTLAAVLAVLSAEPCRPEGR